MFELNKFYNEAENELNDDLVLQALRQAIDDYENGELIEVSETLSQIIDAIQEVEANEIF